MRWTTILAATLIVALLVVAQLVLPGIAGRQLRDRLARSGQVLEVKVEAFPAIMLLWHRADHVVVRFGRYSSTPSNLSSLLDQAADVGSLDASATEVQTGLVTLRDATLSKRGDQLTGSAELTEQDLRAAVPFLAAVRPVASSNGQLVLRGTATVFGVTATADARVAAVNGALVVQPDVPFGGLATVTVFSDPRLHVDSVTAATTPTGFSVQGRATLN